MSAKCLFLLLTLIMFTESCKDDNKYCGHWEGKGFCSRGSSVSYMRQYCKRSCKLCGSVCRDDNKSCGYWEGQGLCSRGSFVSYMRQNCKRSCGLCVSVPSSCNDLNKDCYGWMKRGECSKNPKYVFFTPCLNIKR